MKKNYYCCCCYYGNAGDKHIKLTEGHWLIKREERPQLFLADANGAAMATGVRDNECWVDTGNHDVTQVLSGNIALCRPIVWTHTLLTVSMQHTGQLKNNVESLITDWNNQYFWMISKSREMVQVTPLTRTINHWLKWLIFLMTAKSTEMVQVTSLRRSPESSS